MILLLTGLGVIVAALQAVQARRAATDARHHEEAALEASRKTAEANERAAVALEEANALARASSAKPRWALAHVDGDHYRITNQGPGSAYEVRVDLPDSPAILVRDSEQAIAELEEGLATSFWVARSFDSGSADPTLVVTWRDSTDGERREVKTSLP